MSDQERKLTWKLNGEIAFALLVHQGKEKKKVLVLQTIQPPSHLESEGDSFPQSLRKSSSSPRWLLTLRCLCDTPGPQHRQNDVWLFLKTFPVNSLLGAGSSNFLSLSQDLLSFLSQQLPHSPGQGEEYSQQDWPGGREDSVFHELIRVPALCHPRAACSPVGVHASEPPCEWSHEKQGSS